MQSESPILNLSDKECKMHRVILWSQGQAVFSVQSQNVEGWAIETLLQNCHIDIGLDLC